MDTLYSLSRMTLHSPLRNREVLLSYTTLNMGERSCGTGCNQLIDFLKCYTCCTSGNIFQLIEHLTPPESIVILKLAFSALPAVYRKGDSFPSDCPASN